MSFDKALIDDFVFVRLKQDSQAEDISAIQDFVAAAHRAFGRPIYYFIIVGAEVAPPTQEVRRLVGESLAFLSEMCESIHIVLEGKGAISALKRMVVVGVMLVSQTGRKTTVHDDVEAGVREVAKKRGLDPDSVLAAARAGKII
jgi:hypothetical protein